MADIKAFLLKYKDDIIKPVAVLLTICVAIALALSLTNKVTVNRIAKLQAENEAKAMRQLIDAEEFELTGLAIIDVAEPFDYHIAKNGGECVGYIFITSAKGYGGEISVMTAINTDGSIKAVSILSADNETPGLGQNVTKQDFYSQYSGKTDEIQVVKSGADSKNNQINAVTGATISSRAVTLAVNRALDNFAAVQADINGGAKSEK